MASLIWITNFSNAHLTVERFLASFAASFLLEFSCKSSLLRVLLPILLQEFFSLPSFPNPNDPTKSPKIVRALVENI